MIAHVIAKICEVPEAGSGQVVGLTYIVKTALSCIDVSRIRLKLFLSPELGRKNFLLPYYIHPVGKLKDQSG